MLGREFVVHQERIEVPLKTIDSITASRLPAFA
jgi:hypothetical protein